MRTLFARTLLAVAALLATRAEAATRTERFTAPGPVSALELSSIRGEVRVSAGATFAATVELVAGAGAEAALAAAKISFSYDKGKVSLRTEPAHERHDDGVAANYTVTVPAAAEVKVRTVDGGLKIAGLTGPLAADTVNGAIDVAGNGELHLRTVNGSVRAHVGAASAGKISADSVNGEVLVWLPAAAGVHLSARTLNGEILSTFPFPAQAGGGPPVERHYDGAIGSGALAVSLRTVNGRVALCAAGTNVEAARPLVTADSKFWLPHLAGLGPPGRHHDGGDVNVDKVVGDFQLDTRGGDVHVEAISGRARIRTRSGDVRLGTVGGPAEIDTGGGDIRIHAADGDVKVKSGGGDLRIDAIGGRATLETQGGDIRLDSCKGMVDAKTRGGDITVQHAQEGVHAETDGGDVTVELTARPKDPHAQIALDTRGGDVTLTVPANLAADVRIEVNDAEGDDKRIVSEFPQVTVQAGGHGRIAVGKLGAGGVGVTIHARSGKVTLKRGPSS
jgi:DUF4097 and DUF4098 domain-containing protein YvlB